jgi:hypothetical protein
MNNKAENKKILVEQLKLMADKLVEESMKLPDESLIVEYDNGGGQKGVRENPFFPAYEKLLASYTKTLTALEGMADGVDTELVSLNSFKSKFKIAK